MFDEPSIKAALADIGYRRLRRNVYRAEWGMDVEHFFYFRLHGTPKDTVSGNFGIRTKEADVFADGALKAYGPEIFRLCPVDTDPDNCVMRYTFGQLASWGLVACLYIPSMSGPALARKVRDDIERILFPVIRGITTLDRFLAFALRDEEPCPWVRCNCAMRAAIVAYLARQLDAQPGEVRAMLAPHKKQIEPVLRGGREPDPDAYIERLIEDAAASIAQQRT
jgi:hypothetical protein